MKKLLAISAALSALFVSGAYAQSLDPVKYYTIDQNSVMITEVTDRGVGTIAGSTHTIPSTGGLPTPPSIPDIAPSTSGDENPGAGVDINGTLDTIDKVVNLAQKIWDIIAKNQPVVNITVNYANAIPLGITHWTQLQGWSKPGTRTYEFGMKNLLGMEVVKVRYQLHWTYGGNYQGKGKFLTGVTVEPLSVNTDWGYNVDLSAEVPDSTIANVGTTADPIASMQVQLKWKIHTIMKDAQEKAIFYVQGDGFVKEMGMPCKNGIEYQTRQKIQEVQKKIENPRFD